MRALIFRWENYPEDVVQGVFAVQLLLDQKCYPSALQGDGSAAASKVPLGVSQSGEFKL